MNKTKVTVKLVIEVEDIDKIAKQFNIKQNLVAKLFMETMQTILDKVEKGGKDVL